MSDQQTQDLSKAWSDLTHSWGDLTGTLAQNSSQPSWFWKIALFGIFFWVAEFALRIFIRKTNPLRQFTPLAAVAFAVYCLWFA